MGQAQNENDEEIERINKIKFEEMLRIKAQKSVESDAKPIALNDANFGSEISGQPLIVVDFWAPWCGPCRMVGPIIEELAKEYAGRVTFGKLNVDENPLVSNRFQVRSIPTILIFKNGRAVDGVVGAMPKAFFESKIKLYLS